MQATTNAPRERETLTVLVSCHSAGKSEARGDEGEDGETGEREGETRREWDQVYREKGERDVRQNEEKVLPGNQRYDNRNGQAHLTRHFSDSY